MLEWELKIVKLGGSVITQKERPLYVRRDVIKRLVIELRNALLDRGTMKLILVHGGGSFGHYFIRRCLETKGFIDTECFSRTSYFMTILNSIIVKEMLDCDLPSVSIAPHTIFRYLSGNKMVYDLNIVKEYLYRGIIPILYGDVVLGDSGYRVLSGDSISWILAMELGAREVVFVTDVNGLYDRDPKKYKDAVMIRYAKAYELANFEFTSDTRDVTGSMGFKLMEGIKLGIKGTTVKIINGFVEGVLYKVLVDRDFFGTVIEY